MRFLLLSGLYKWEKSHERIVHSLLNSLAEGLLVKVRRVKFSPGLAEVEYKGVDGEIFRNILRKRFGEAHLYRSGLRRLQRARGVIVNHSRRGVILDLGVRVPYEDQALLPRRVLNSQLADGANFTVEELVNRFCLVPFMSLEVDITMVEPRLIAELSFRQVKAFWRWDLLPLSVIVVSGSLETDLEKALERLKLRDTIIGFESSTFETHILELRLCEDPNPIAEALRVNLEDCRVAVYIYNVDRFLPSHLNLEFMK